jgi:hypothetical protein
MGSFESPELTVVVFAIGFIIIPQIISIIVYYRVLGALPEEQRRIRARLTWLLLVPLFSTAYEFWVVRKLSLSLQSFFAAADEPTFGGCGQVLGMTFCAFNALALIPVVGFVFGILGFLFWVVYMLTMLEIAKGVLQNKERYRQAQRARLNRACDRLSR